MLKMNIQIGKKNKILSQFQAYTKSILFWYNGISLTLKHLPAMSRLT